jgi:phosphoserine phosphatase RsbU/P
MIGIEAPSETATIESLRETELAEARAIQLAMLASEGLHTPRVTIESEFQPVTEVGGDFLDYFLLSDGTAGLYLGDVTGKGLPAALFAALAVGTLRGVHKTGTAPSTVLSQLNKRMLLKNVTVRYAAMQYAHLNPETGVMRVASAGMNGPFHLRAEGCDDLELCGIPPGLFPNTEYEMKEIQLVDGDSVVFLSDGLIDAMNGEGEILGIEKIVELLADCREKSPQEILRTMFSFVEAYAKGQAQQDDRTAAVLRYANSCR